MFSEAELYGSNSEEIIKVKKEIKETFNWETFNWETFNWETFNWAGGIYNSKLPYPFMPC
jgi:hypothetical protein